MKFTILDKMEYPLKFSKIVKYIPKERNTFDRRKKQSTLILSYYDCNNFEYRKAIHKKPYTPVNDFLISPIIHK